MPWQVHEPSEDVTQLPGPREPVGHLPFLRCGKRGPAFSDASDSLLTLRSRASV